MTIDTTYAMRALREQGLSDTAIGKRYGISRQAVHQALGNRTDNDTRREPQFDLTPPPIAVTSAHGKLAETLKNWRYGESLTQSQAAKALHLSHGSVYNKWERGRGCSLPELVIAFIEQKYTIMRLEAELEKLLTMLNR